MKFDEEISLIRDKLKTTRARLEKIQNLLVLAEELDTVKGWKEQR